MNILSYDIEEWYVEKKLNGGHSDKYNEFDKYLGEILDSLDRYNQKATFFCVGKIATDFPYVVKKIIERGHEIGCHSNEHLWLTTMSPKQFKLDTSDAINALQDICGRKIISYRAPAFSIGETNKWAFEILAECGIERDSSIFPAERDFGGFPSYPTDKPALIEFNGIKIKEFPICMAKVLNKEFAFSGGGYFRLFPYQFIKKQINNNIYSIVYLHIGDMLPEGEKFLTKEEYEYNYSDKGSLFNRLKRYVKSNLGTSTAFSKMMRLLSENQFTNLEQADSKLDWSKVEIIKI